jgi:L-rhamnose isomerase/sugar isomerase
LNETDTAVIDDVAYMIDQSHNIKTKIEATIQTVVTAQELFFKAALVDRERLAELQSETKTVEAEELLRSAFWTDVRPLLKEWRQKRGLPEDPLQALRESGYVQRIEDERRARNAALSVSYA